MTEEIKDKKSCNNCKYFRQHFIILMHRFQKLSGIGHCRYSKNQKIPVQCKHWENIEKTKAQQRTSIKKTLTAMSYNIDQIPQILQNDKD